VNATRRSRAARCTPRQQNDEKMNQDMRSGRTFVETWRSLRPIKLFRRLKPSSMRHLAVRVGRPSGSGLVCRKLGEVGYSLYAACSYLAKHRTPQRGEGLAGHDLISFTGAPAATSPFFMSESLDEARIALRCDNPLIQLQAAANGIGIAELACFLGDDCVDLVRIWPGEPPALRSVWLVLHEDMRRSARIRVVSSMIGDTFRRQRKVLQHGRPR
jgi:DNA-binding transcriptional LysR family regulator